MERTETRNPSPPPSGLRPGFCEGFRQLRSVNRAAQVPGVEGLDLGRELRGQPWGCGEDEFVDWVPYANVEDQVINTMALGSIPTLQAGHKAPPIPNRLTPGRVPTRS
jgi:hypothetical protein